MQFKGGPYILNIHVPSFQVASGEHTCPGLLTMTTVRG